jgi:hypothetical protein
MDLTLAYLKYLFNGKQLKKKTPNPPRKTLPAIFNLRR